MLLYKMYKYIKLFFGVIIMKKQNTLRKLFSLFALTLAALILFTSCAVKPIESTEEELAVIGTISGREVRYEEYRYVVLNHKRELETKYGEGIWDTPQSAEQYRAELLELVNESICSDYYAIMNMADYYYLGGAELMFSEEAILEAVQETVEGAVDECGSMSKYKKMLKEMYLTDHLFRFYLTAEECSTELFYILCNDLGVIASDDDSVEEYMHSDDFLRTNHVYISGISEENAALAQSIKEQLENSDSPELEIILLKGQYCHDYTMTTTHGKYFARYTSDYGDEYELAAFDLYEGEISEVVTTDDGYYVIMRLPVEEDYLTTRFDDFKDDILGSQFNVIIQDYRERLSFELNDYGKSLDILEIE